MQQSQTNPVTAQMLAQFMQGAGSGTAPLIESKAKTTVTKPGKAATFRNLGHALLQGPAAAADLVKGDTSGFDDAAREHVGVFRLQRAFGSPKVTTQQAQVPINPAPQFYWGGLLNQQNPNIKF